MGRLIDADKLIEAFRDFKEWENDYGRPIHAMSEIQRIDKCINITQEQPTAYDVDKVVAELKDKAQEYKAVNMDYAKGLKDGYEYAIEIVEGGGIKNE